MLSSRSPRLLFLDDAADRASAFLAGHPDAVWVQTVEQCLELLAQRWDEVYLDHDLGRGKGTSLNSAFLTPEPLASSIYVHVPEAHSPRQRATSVASLFPFSEGGAEAVRMGPAFHAAITRGESPCQDAIHPTTRGQAILAKRLGVAVLDLLHEAGNLPSTGTPRNSR